MNVLFGVAASFWGLLGLFGLIRGIDGYLQGIRRARNGENNAAWFRRNERGRSAGIFGFMINLGRFGMLGPALLAGFVFLGMWQIPPLHWRWLFWIPAGIATLVAIGMVAVVKDTPQKAGFLGVNPDEPQTDDVRASLPQVFMAIASNPVVWIIACAYACTGAVRQGIDQWFPRFLQDVHGLTLDSSQFQWVGFLIPFVASAGSLLSGYVSDTLFGGRRAPCSVRKL